MSIFNILNLIGGLSLFLFGMSLMGQALERRAGNRLKLRKSMPYCYFIAEKGILFFCSYNFRRAPATDLRMSKAL